MADVEVSFEQAVQRLLHMYSTERSGKNMRRMLCVVFTIHTALNNQIAELQETLAGYQEQLGHIMQEKKEQYEK